MFKELSSPIYLQWEVTSLCNYKCLHCYNAWRNSQNTIRPSKHLYQKIADEIIANKVFYTTITGGEPIIVFDEIKPYLEQLHEAGICISMNTNASLITEDIASQLKKIGIEHVLVSVPSGNEHVCDRITQYQDSLAQTMEGIRNLLNEDISVSINMVISLENIDTIYETAKIFKDLPIRSFCATRAATPCSYKQFSKYRINREQLEAVFDKLLYIEDDLRLNVSTLEFYPYCAFNQEKHFYKFGNKMCSAGKTEAAISYDGNIKPCPHTVVSYGNINDGLRTAWKAMNSDWRTEKLIPDVCSECGYRILCAGGCKQEAYNCFHSLGSIDPLADPICGYKRTKKERVNLKEYYTVNANIKVRKENNNNVILFKQANKWVLIQKKLADILLHNKTISYQLLSERLQIDRSEYETIVLELISKHIIF